MNITGLAESQRILMSHTYHSPSFTKGMTIYHSFAETVVTLWGNKSMVRMAALQQGTVRKQPDARRGSGYDLGKMASASFTETGRQKQNTHIFERCPVNHIRLSKGRLHSCFHLTSSSCSNHPYQATCLQDQEYRYTAMT